MGNTLYWKITPKKTEEEYSGLYFSSWNFLSELWNKEYKEDLADTILTKENIPQLKTILITAKTSNNDELSEDISELIDAINKFDSITLIIKG